MATKRDTRNQSLFNKMVSAMPDGYYSGDKPNPNLREFVERHVKERPYDPETDDYHVQAFAKPIEATKATAIYNMHTYWSKKPHDAIRQYVRHYTKPGDLVLDPFCGSGGTALAALMEGRKAIAIDRSPAATFITKNYCTPVDVADLENAFQEVKCKVKPEIDWLYETTCDRCGGKATTIYTVYSQVFQCPRCMEKVPLFDCVKAQRETATGKPKTVNVCPHCHKRGQEEPIRSQSKKYGSVPVMSTYRCNSGCTPPGAERRYNDSDQKKRKYFETYDLNKIHEIEDATIPYWYPQGYDMTSFNRYQRDALFYYQVVEVADLFTRRSLRCIAAIFDAIDQIEASVPVTDMLRFGLTGILLGVSRMNQHRPDVSFPLNIMVGTYYVPQISQEEYILKHYENKIRRLLKGLRALAEYEMSPDLLISTASCADQGLQAILSNSVDFIFTDPPYAGKYQYGELNYAWEAWLKHDTSWHDEEIIVNDTRGVTVGDWARLMRIAMAESYRVLKPGRWLSLCYHDTSEGTWALIQDIMAEAGFIVDQRDGALFIDTGGKTYNQTQGDKVNKRDLVINFRKPKPGEVAASVTITGNEDRTTLGDKVRRIIREYLGAHPGTTKDRIYDEVVSSMVRSGQMEAHNFDEILRGVAEEVKTPVMKNLFRNEDPNLFGTHEVSRWYLRETEPDVGDAAECAMEDKAAERLESFMKAHLKKHAEDEGVHYSDLFEQYVYSVKEKPRRQLADFLPDYFFKTEAGTWRPPASLEEAKAKAEGRANGTGRRVKRYIALLELGASIPDRDRPNDASLAEWVRHCKRAGLYEQGKLLYEKGGLNLEKLPEEVMVGVEEDYQVCARMLSRDEAAKPTRTRKAAKE